MLFSELDSELPKLAKREPVEAAVFAAMPVLECVAHLQLATRSEESESLKEFGVKWLGTLGPRLGPDLERLDRYQTDDVVDALSMLHPLPVVIGDTVEESYTEAIFNLGCQWYRALISCIPKGEGAAATWKNAIQPFVPHQFKSLPLTAKQCELARHSLIDGPFRPADVNEKYLHVAIRKEAQRITGKRLSRYDDDDESGVPLRLLKDATSLQQHMLESLWKKPRQRKSEFIAAAWREKGATEEAMERAIGRLSTFLLEQNFPGTVQVKGNLVILTRPTK
jgi:hypothetical protein